MAHLWTRSENPEDKLKKESEWTRIGVDPEGSFGPEPGMMTATDIDTSSVAVYDPSRTRFLQGSDGSWALLSAPDTSLRVNGLPVPGIRILRDRDELYLDGRTAFFSTERLARVEPFPPHPSTTYCPRCKSELNAGHPAVCCPGCGIWHHQRPEKDMPCWTHGSHCALCPHPTALTGEWQWIPEAL